MKPADAAQKQEAFIRLVGSLLLLVFFVKLAGFFTWSENVSITRVFKIISRIGMTVAIFGVYKMILKRGAIGAFKWQHEMSIGLYVGYLLLGLISFLWSTNIGYSALQWIMDIESLVFAYYFIACFILLDQYFPRSGIKFYAILGNGIMAMMMIFIIGMFLAPDDFYRMTHGGEEARLGGFFMNPNELGMLGGVGVSCFIFQLYTKGNKFWPILKIILLLYAIIMTGSRSSAVGCLLIAFFHIQQTKNRKLKALMYASTFLVIPLVIQKIFLKEGGLEEVLSMTGRLPFWKALITEGLPRELFFGFGFMRIDYKEHFESVHTYAGHMTHNTFIQVLMNLGIIGFTLVMAQVIFTFRGFFKTEDKERKLMFIGIIIPVMINSFTEFGVFGETNYGILFYQFLVVFICLKANPHLTPRERGWLERTNPHFSKYPMIGANRISVPELSK